MAKVRGMSLFQKTGLLAFCLFGLIAVTTSALSAWTLHDRLAREYISKGSAIARSIAGASQEILLVRDAATVQSMIDQYLEIEGVAYVFVVDADNLVVSHTFVPEMPRRLRGIQGDKSGQIVTELKLDAFGRVIDICAPILAGVAGYVHVGMDKELIMAYFWKVVMEMQALLAVVFWICVGILYMVTRRISRPLSLLTRYAGKLAAHDFSATIDIRTSDELEVLGRAMQSMARELALLFSGMESEVDKTSGDLREHMAYLSAIIDNLADGLLVVGVSGDVTVLNPAMRHYFDLGDGEYRGFPASDLFPQEILDMTSGVRKCDEGILSAEVPLARGRTGKAVGSSILIDEPDRRCMGGVILVRDITREKELDKLKTDFISTVSHELRTPMTSVLGFAKIIRKKLEQSVFPSLDGEAGVERPISQIRGNMDIIVSEAERLRALINDVLDIARMEAGKMQWRDQSVAMADVLVQAMGATKGMWKAKGLDVILEIEESLPEVHGDHDRLVQVVVNLLSNAVKFTDVGTITCSARVERGFITVSVADKGAGIASADVDHVFDKFKQVGDTLTDKPAGTGLGLPICRQIVERHGGRIWAESTLGKGSVFHFAIPALDANGMPGETGRVRPGVMRFDGGAVPEPEAGAEAVAMADAPLVLVVDDDPSLLIDLRQIFEDQRFRVKTATNGHDAVALARDLRPDLITMDIMMPGMDGHDTIERLRGTGATRRIPILVITALSGEEGTGDIALTRPVDENRLMKATRALLRDKSVYTSCIVLGEPDKCDFDGLALLCPEEIEFSTADELWARMEQGFNGVVFIPAGEVRKVPLEKLTKQSDVSIVILPACS